MDNVKPFRVVEGLGSALEKNKGSAKMAAELRRLADLAEQGEIFECVVAYQQRDEYKLHKAASPIGALVLSSLLHDSALRDMKG